MQEAVGLLETIRACDCRANMAQSTFGRRAGNGAIVMARLPGNLADGVGPPTLLAAWNAAGHVAQIDEERLGAVVGTRRHFDATCQVLEAHACAGLRDGSPVISRKRG